MWSRMAARKEMSLTRLEREILTDSLLKIQSIEASLKELDTVKIPDLDEIHSCLRTANNSFRSVLRSGTQPSPVQT